MRIITMKNFTLFMLLCSLFLLLSGALDAASAQAGKVDVSGKVTDETGQPLVGVTVLMKAEMRGTVTDQSGVYFLANVPADSDIEFSHLGYRTHTQKVGGANVINVTLTETADMINDIVVVGYGTRKKGSITGSIANVGPEDLDRVHSATTSAMLSGKLAGLSFRQNDGRPGSGASIQIRNYGGDPLFIVDGVVQDKGYFDQLGPDDIEQISILKDASSAIYGLRAGDGVVLVTTKKGKENTPAKVSVNMFHGWQNWTRFPSGVNAYEWQLAFTEGQVNKGLNPTLTPEELEKYREGTEYGYRTFDWYNYIVQKNAPQSSINVNVSGGGNNTKYYVSYTHFDQQAAFKDYKYKRSNLQSNLEVNVWKGLKIGANLSGRIDSKRNPAVSGADTDDYWQPRNALLNLLPWETPFANDNPDYLNYTEVPEANFAGINYATSGYYKYDQRMVSAIMYADYDFKYVKGLNARCTNTYQVSDVMIDNFEYAYDAYTYDPVNEDYIKKPVNSVANHEKTRKKVFNQMRQFMLNYDRTFGKHHVLATLAYERTEYTTNEVFLKGSPNNNFLEPLNLSDLLGLSDSGTLPQARIGYIARVVYDYADKYYIEFSGRRDASWKFIQHKRWNNFPSVSAGWRISEEPFFKNNVRKEIVSDLKLRASYGIVGDDRALGIGDYAYYEGYNYNTSVPVIDGVPVIGMQYRDVNTRMVGWLKNHIFNVGVDVSFMQGKLYANFDYFRKKRTGLLQTRNDIYIPSELGYTIERENLNKDVYFGGEAAVTYRNKVGDFNYSVGVNISYARAKMLYIYNEMMNFSSSLDYYKNGQAGRYKNVNWGYLTEGVFQSQDQINNWHVNIDGKGNTSLLPGDFIIKDVNGDGKIDSNDMRPMAYMDNENSAPQPIWNGGLSLSMSWKGIDLAADFSFAAGYSFTPNWETKWPFQNSRTLVKATQFDNRWRHEDPFDPNSAWIPGKTPALRTDAREYSSWNLKHQYWTQNVRALRLRTLEVGYTLPSKLMNDHIEKLRFYVNTYNLFSIDNVKKFGVDPEIADRNGMQYPQSRVVNIGVNITF